MSAARMIAAAVLALSGLVAASQGLAQGGFYIGASAGRSDIDPDVTTGLITSGTVDGKSSGYKIFGGYQFNPYFGVDLAYVDLGKATYSGDFFGDPVIGGRVEIWGLNVSAVGTLPLNPSFAVFGKIGVFAWEARTKDVTGGVPFSITDNGGDFSAGIGLSFHFTPNLSARVEWERFGLGGYDVDLDHANLLSVGVAYRF